MKLERVEIENYRAIGKLDLPLDPRLTVLHGDNGHGKTSVLAAIATGLGSIPMLLPDVSGIGFRKADSRDPRVGLIPVGTAVHLGIGRDPARMRVGLTTTEGIRWDRQAHGARRTTDRQNLKEALDSIVEADRKGNCPIDLPIVAFYDTDRAALDQPQRRKDLEVEFPRYAALQDALSPRTNFRDLFKWFYAKENEELRTQKKLQNFTFRLGDLEAVRSAIATMIPEVSNPRVELSPLRFVVSVDLEDGTHEELSIDQLSGGFRIMLALAADLARRMAQGNPHLEDPLQSEAIVLIDEIELHLHPSWQQTVLADLSRTFPNTQFIVSTHSPQVLTTVKPENVLELRLERGGIVAEVASAPTYGAEAGDVLPTVMGVNGRPGDNEFVKKLNCYRSLVADGKGESSEALELRRDLDELSPRDPALNRADTEIRRRRLIDSMDKSR